MLPAADEVVTNLETLTSKCLRGKNYCRQVLCLYELAKVRASGASTGSCLGGWGAVGTLPSQLVSDDPDLEGELLSECWPL